MKQPSPVNYTLVEGRSTPRVRQVRRDNSRSSEDADREVISPVSTNLDDVQNLEEVYVCNCCGVSKELQPAIKWLPTFRCLFFLFNFFVLAFGFGNLGIGLWFRIDPKVYEIHRYIETQNFTISGWILLFSGSLACLVALFGFAAANRSRVGLLLCYLVFMIPLTLAFVGALVLLTVYGLGLSLERVMVKEIYEQIRRRSMNTVQNLYETSSAAQFLDFIQVKLKCCGATDHLDYSKLGMVVPTTCYSFVGNVIDAPGCGRAMRELLDIRAGLAIGLATGSVFAHLVSVILSALMFCSIYQWQAQPRPATPAVRMRGHEGEDYPLGLYQQRPRSRTPIVTS